MPSFLKPIVIPASGPPKSDSPIPANKSKSPSPSISTKAGLASVPIKLFTEANIESILTQFGSK